MDEDEQVYDTDQEDREYSSPFESDEEKSEEELSDDDEPQRSKKRKSPPKGGSFGPTVGGF